MPPVPQPSWTRLPRASAAAADAGGRRPEDLMGRLPDELLVSIAGALDDAPDVAALARTSRRLHAAAAPRLVALRAAWLAARAAAAEARPVPLPSHPQFPL